MLLPKINQKSIKNRSKIDVKTESKTECLLKSIFSRFGWILEAKLGCKIQPNRSDLAWRGVMARRGEAWRGVARRGVARRGVEGVKGVKGVMARAHGGMGEGFSPA